uniref:Uncharacterized protein n=1 Tax=Anguilla anguilla TaxID=7936 RepID=A0A0E9XRP9_ANGAN
MFLKINVNKASMHLWYLQIPFNQLRFQSLELPQIKAEAEHDSTSL